MPSAVSRPHLNIFDKINCLRSPWHSLHHIWTAGRCQSSSVPSFALSKNKNWKKGLNYFDKNKPRAANTRDKVASRSVQGSALSALKLQGSFISMPAYSEQQLPAAASKILMLFLRDPLSLRLKHSYIYIFLNLEYFIFINTLPTNPGSWVERQSREVHYSLKGSSLRAFLFLFSIDPAENIYIAPERELVTEKVRHR